MGGMKTAGLAKEEFAFLATHVWCCYLHRDE
jgi:hypothetical protein